MGWNEKAPLTCFACWYRSMPYAPKEYVFVFAYDAQQAHKIFMQHTGIMFDYCEEAEFYRAENDFTIPHEYGEVWGCNACI